MNKKKEEKKLIKQIGNSGYTCRCGAYMYANIYADEIVYICPQCLENFCIQKEGENGEPEIF